jgi:membrane protein
MTRDLRNRLSDFFATGLWEADISSLTGFRAFLIKTLRLLMVAVHEFTEGQLTLRAMSLVYTTLLSIVPILAISFSVLKAFGVHNEILEPFMIKFLAPLGAKGEEITSRIISFVENMKVGVLGSVGLGLLFYTVISVIQKVEKSFNTIWRIRKTRSLSRRFSDYISVIIIGPVLIFSAIGLTASLMSNTVIQKIISMEPFGSLFYFIAGKAPYIIVCAAFTFLYIFIPNTKVKFKSALVGGIVAGILWETAGWAFASFIVTSAKYAAIYSGFAILIMFMLWLYLSWLILLVGAQLSFYHQYPHFLTVNRDVFRLSNRLRERLTFLVIYFIGYNFYHNKPHLTLNDLVNRLELPFDTVHDILTLLEQNSLVLETAEEPHAYIPSRSIETIKLKDLLDSVRIAEKGTLSVEKRVASIPAVDNIMTSLDSALDETLGEKTLKDIVLSTAEGN